MRCQAKVSGKKLKNWKNLSQQRQKKTQSSIFSWIFPSVSLKSRYVRCPCTSRKARVLRRHTFQRNTSCFFGRSKKETGEKRRKKNGRKHVFWTVFLQKNIPLRKKMQKKSGKQATKKPSFFPLYWLFKFNRDLYNGFFLSPIIPYVP